MMATTPKTRKKRDSEPRTARASVSFPAELYEALERIATEKKVSVAWVVREAAAEYVIDNAPLQGRN
jgi:metal-responsive CopG/Arc/MetJ family transcriptional regulator